MPSFVRSGSCTVVPVETKVAHTAPKPRILPSIEGGNTLRVHVAGRGRFFPLARRGEGAAKDELARQGRPRSHPSGREGEKNKKNGGYHDANNNAIKEDHANKGRLLVVAALKDIYEICTL